MKRVQWFTLFGRSQSGHQSIDCDKLHLKRLFSPLESARFRLLTDNTDFSSHFSTFQPVGCRCCQCKSTEDGCWIREKCPRREKIDVLALIIVQASVIANKKESEIHIPAELPLIHTKLKYPLFTLIRDPACNFPRNRIWHPTVSELESTVDITGLTL